MTEGAEDWTDRHVARWRDHWIDVAIEDDVEAIVARIGRLNQYINLTTQRALVEVGLQDFEYDTLHQLMIRDTPGLASPSALAADLEERLLGGQLEVVPQSADPDHDRLDVVLERDVDPVVAPARDVAIGPVLLGHAASLPVRWRIVR